MTVLSGLARSFPELALARIGVGIGEASAAPAAFSLLSDYFPPARRATVLAIYSSGIYIGAGLGLAVGGLVVNAGTRPSGAAAPFGLHGWQVAFFIVGLPGLLLALWVRTLREPVRGSADGLVAASSSASVARVSPRAARGPPAAHAGPSRARRRRSARHRAQPRRRRGDRARRGAAHPSRSARRCSGSRSASASTPPCRGSQALALRDRPTPACSRGRRRCAGPALGFALLAFVGYGVGFWLPPYFMRAHSARRQRRPASFSA